MDPQSKGKYRPNLDTVIEVPLRNKTKLWKRMKSLTTQPPEIIDEPDAALASLLRVIGAPLTPNDNDQQLLNNNPMSPTAEAKYIVRQYVAAMGGEKALSSMNSLCLTGKMKIKKSKGRSKSLKSISGCGGHRTLAGFMLSRKRELWCLELVSSSGSRVISMGSDGKTSLRWLHSYSNRYMPLPLGHLLQGLNPMATAKLFSNCREPINKEDCSILTLKVDDTSKLSSSNIKIVEHTVLGYFNHKTGLLEKLEDSRVLILTAFGKHDYWKSTMESYFEDYRAIDGANIAHRGRTYVSLSGESSKGRAQRRKLKWKLEEINLDVKGLSMECFLPPSDLKKEEETCGMVTSSPSAKLRSPSLSL